MFAVAVPVPSVVTVVWTTLPVKTPRVVEIVIVWFAWGAPFACHTTVTGVAWPRTIVALATGAVTEKLWLLTETASLAVIPTAAALKVSLPALAAVSWKVA